LGFLNSLVGHGMSLRGTAQLGELASYEGGFRDRSQDADSGFATLKLAADAMAIRVV
jgi:hypothetical protein